jgi:hypothetical protein
VPAADELSTWVSIIVVLTSLCPNNGLAPASGRADGPISIASALHGSFISRNNDVAGYWGIGKLCLLAQQHTTTIVRLDLVAGSIAPGSSEFAKLVSGYVAS